MEICSPVLIGCFVGLVTDEFVAVKLRVGCFTGFCQSICFHVDEICRDLEFGGGHEAVAGAADEPWVPKIELNIHFEGGLSWGKAQSGNDHIALDKS